jgi:alpha-1,2-mannosyltransferase
MAEEVGVPGRLASAIRSWSQDVRAYKGGELYEDVLLPYLDEKHQQQLKDGLIEGEETEREKSRKSYPL